MGELIINWNRSKCHQTAMVAAHTKVYYGTTGTTGTGTGTDTSTGTGPGNGSVVVSLAAAAFLHSTNEASGSLRL